MSSPTPQPGPLPAAQANTSAFWFKALGFLALLTLCAGGVPLWGRVVFLCGTGLMLVRNPPRHRLPFLLTLGLGFFALAHLVHLLPGFSLFRPEWREVATGDFQFELPSTLGPQPWIVLERSALAFAAIGWLAMLAGHRLENDTRRLLLRWLAIGGALLAGLVAIANLIGLKNPLAEQSQVFSLFPNRNQTGLVLAVACTIGFGLGLRAFHYRKGKEAAFGFSLAGLCFASTLTLQGRAAPVLAGLGCVLITSLSGHPKDILRLLKIVVPLGLLAGTAVFVIGSDIATRLEQAFVGSTATDFRVLLMRDTGKLLLDHPVVGVGGGSFPDLFPLYRDESLTFQPVLHPEADWLWLAAEHGALGVAAGLILSGVAFSFLSFQRKNRGETATNIASVAFIVIWLHSLVDGPFHRPGTLLLAAVCLALGRHLSHEPRRSHRLTRRLWQGLGGGLIAVGCFWLAALVFQQPWHSSLALAQSRLGPSESFRREPSEVLRQRLETALRFSPLDAQAHFDLARLSLLLENDPEAAQMSYLRARFLDPHAADRFLQEGLDWAPTHPERAISAWREALLGQSPYRENLLINMARLGLEIEGLRESFERLTHSDRELRFHYLSRLDYPGLKQQLPEDFRRNPGLFGFSAKPEENQARRTLLLNRALHAGLGPELLALLASQAELRAEVWPFYVRVAQGDAERGEAARLAYAKAAAPQPPLIPHNATLATLRDEFALDPFSPAKVLPLVEALRQERFWKEILAALDRQAGQPPSATLAYYRAEALLRLNRPTEACDAWNTFAKLSGLIQ